MPIPPGNKILVKGLLTTIVPWLGLNKALFPGGGIRGVPLDSHEHSLNPVNSLNRKRMSPPPQKNPGTFS